MGTRRHKTGADRKVGAPEPRTLAYLGKTSLGSDKFQMMRPDGKIVVVVVPGRN